MNPILRLIAFATFALAVSFARSGYAQCVAPSQWFPHESTPEPDFHSPSSSCEFHQWGWQTFLWLTQSTGGGRIRLMDMPRADELFMPGRAPGTLNAAAVARQRSQSLILAPRVLKANEVSTFGELRQAGSRGVLVDKNGKPVYYASHVSSSFYQFVRTNRLYLKDTYIHAPPTMNFPVKSLELKSSWRVVASGESTDGLFTTAAKIHPLKCKNEAQNCTGDDVVVDLTRVEDATVALVGLHVVGVVEDHPEFIWSTFEHLHNAPDLPTGIASNSPNPVSNRSWTFYEANTPASSCNVRNSGTVALDVAMGKLTPHTNVFRQFALGGGGAGDEADVRNLNDSVHAQLRPDSVWKNYFLGGECGSIASMVLSPVYQDRPFSSGLSVRFASLTARWRPLRSRPARIALRAITPEPIRGRGFPR